MASYVKLFLLFLLSFGFASQGITGDGNSEQLSPQYNPKTDPDNPQFDPDYDPAEDANHPLKDKNLDPGEAWEKHRLSDGTPAVAKSRGNWNWGEMFFDSTYNSKLTVTNSCKGAQPVSIYVYNLPYLSIPSSLAVPGKSSIDVDLTIKTPPEPPPPPIVLTPGAPPIPWGWVPPPPPQPGAGTKFHQPNFVDVSGKVVIWHPWVGDCMPKRETYKVSGHIHYKPPDPPPPGPSRIAKTDVCRVYWNIGVPPDQLGGKDCTKEFREFANHYLDKVVRPYVKRDSDAWEWLPSSADVMQMTVSDILVMKERADVLLLEL